MKDPIENKVNKWVQNGESRYSDINLRIIHLDRRLFSDYEPAIGPGPNFLKRLNDWLENVADEEDQKTLFELVPYIFYIGREELNVLYREAYNTVFAKWLIDQVGIDLNSPDALSTLNTEVTNTWFCPFTDSLRINQFYHINDIPGKHDHRPDWRSLRTFGNIERIKKYVQENQIRRIVLLEDFIGNGGQISKAVNFIADNFTEISILIIPLIICPAGMEQSAKFTETHSNIKIVPVISIPNNYFVHEIAHDNEFLFFKKLHSLAKRTYSQVANSSNADDAIDPYGPFGWRKTGGLIVMHTNTPNNSLPLIHNKSETWSPLFKRHKRV
jgi:hypothetical protein